MSTRFEPSISYWPRSGRIRPLPLERLSGTLAKHHRVVLLLHGFNNDPIAAAAAYNRFLRLQSALATVRAHVVGVYWPGDDWQGPLYYMAAVRKAKEVAPILAGDLHTAASIRGPFRIDIVAHSLGTRVALETVRELLERLRASPVPGLTLGRMVFMAGAVPTSYLELDRRSPRPLEPALSALESALNLYSEADDVLRYAFPAGQLLAREGMLPTAIGRKQWPGGTVRVPRLEQQRNERAGHSDYWGGSSKNVAALIQTARFVRGFIDLGAPPSRETPTRRLPERVGSAPRDPAAGRTVPTREV